MWTGRDSLVLTAKSTWESMDRRADWVRVTELPSSTVGSSGNSSAGLPMMSNEVGPQAMWTEFPSVDTVIMSSGSFRMISPNSLADKIREPGWVTWASTRVMMPVSKLYPDRRRPSVEASTKMPSRAEMVLLVATTRPAINTADCKMAFSQENFMVCILSRFPAKKRGKV